MLFLRFSKRPPTDRHQAGAHLPALVCSPVVRVVLCDVIVDSIQCELLVCSQRYGLDYQLCIGVRRFGVILWSRAEG